MARNFYPPKKKVFMLYRALLSTCFILSCLESSITVIQEPFARAYTPNSILANPPPDEIRYAGDRIRYSTCTGTSWLPGNKFLTAINLATSSIQVYEFDEVNRTLNPKKAFNNKDGLNLDRPENLSFSNDHTLLAIPNMQSGNVNIYKVNADSFLKERPGAPFFVISDKKVHGARFSPSGKFLAYVSIAALGSINVYKVSENENEEPTFSFVQKMDNPYYPLKPKSIDFSHDEKFVVVGFSLQISKQPGNASALLESYAFDGNTGIIDPSPLSVIENLYSAETIQFYPDSSYVFAIDQISDKVTGHSFDLTTGKLQGSFDALINPEALLSFPHGMDFTRDGRFLSVTNYGDDKVTVYEILVTP